MIVANPRVSVLVPAYNAGAFLERSLQSALTQTIADLEVIVVDDGSHDDTAAIAESVAADDPRVRLVRNERNVGVAETRNRTLSLARGEWVALLDADDAWLPGRLERLLDHADQADVVTDDLRVVRGAARGDGESWSYLAARGFRTARPVTLTLGKLACFELGHLKPAIRRRFVTEHGIEYDARCTVGEDFFFYVKLLAAGARWVQLPDSHYVYYVRMTAASRSNDPLGWLNEHAELAKTLQEDALIAANPDAVAALERHRRRCEGRIAIRRLAAVAREREVRELVRLLARRRIALAALRRAGQALYERGIRRARDPFGAPPPRLLA